MLLKTYNDRWTFESVDHGNTRYIQVVQSYDPIRLCRKPMPCTRHHSLMCLNVN